MKPLLFSLHTHSMPSESTENLSNLYTSISEIHRQIGSVTYKFISNEEFSSLKSAEESQLVYWSEIIQRLHFSGATTILRLKKWYEAMDVTYQAKNYYGFCSSIRGLIEACSDSFSSIGKIIIPIAENFSKIKAAIDGQAKQVVLATELENELIHYMYGRKLSNDEQKIVQPSHIAKSVRAYLGSMKSDSLDELYSELCQVSHPSAMSFRPFIISSPGIDLALHNNPVDEELNKDILERHRPTIYTATEYALGPAVCSLKLVNLLGDSVLRSLSTNERAFLGLEKYKLWIDLEKRMKT